ncbi:hypothetical protein [Staphylococcus haemolyticus]|jgi:hypothetical protein|uniref:hypothetical protein n=1 Tax=Staphylococcus haemolyticus TaxID=1283 RepID=UPI0010AD6401|nr:hypothetical protein [Staphylococcus haemolyticus]TJX90626.1 hypothetical protein FAF39_04425 [Staphylococcus haemolyticus]TXD22828.1 hypothetical protein FAF28_000935 [Staphylococcus haemolyticus]
MTKIKRKVEMTLPELIEWAWENEVSDKAFYSNLDGGSVYFDKIQNLSIEHEIAINETFTVEIEEEITKETEIPKLVSINRNNLNEVNINFNCSIGQFLDRSDYNYYILNDDDTMTLIWKDGAMVDD